MSHLLPKCHIYCPNVSSIVLNLGHIYWHIYWQMCDMTHSYVWHDSFILTHLLTNTFIDTSIDKETRLSALSSHRICQMCPKLSAIDVTAKTFFERLYLVPELRKFAPRVNCPYAPTPQPFTRQLISRFWYNFFPQVAPHFLDTRFAK